MLKLSRAAALAAACAVLLPQPARAQVAAYFEAIAGRVNAVIALDPGLQASLDKMALELRAAPSERLRIDPVLHAAMVDRAMRCKPYTYLPGASETPDQIREQMKDLRCFKERDDELRQWVGLQRMRLALKQPPLAPLPNRVPRELPLPDGARTRFAAQAPVAAVWTHQRALVVQHLVTGQAWLNEPAMPSQDGFTLSPNGRVLFEHRDLQRGRPLHIRLVETGEVLVVLDKVFRATLLGHEHMVIIGLDGRTQIQNLDQQHIWDAPALDNTGVHAAYPVQGVPGRYALMAANELLVADVQASDARHTRVTVVARHPFATAGSGTFHHLLPDGRTLVVAAAELNRFDLVSQQWTSDRFAPARIGWFWPTAQADTVVLKLALDEPGAGGWSDPLVYSFSGKTLAPVRPPEAQLTGLQWVEPLQRLGHASGSSTQLLDLVLDAAVPAAQWIAGFVRDTAQRKQARLAQEVEDTKKAGGRRPEAPLEMLADGAPVLGVGVRQGNRAASAERRESGVPFGVVNVHVQASPRPMVLLLSSVERVRWNITLQRGAKLKAVLVMAQEPPIVDGAGHAPLRHIGRDPAVGATGPALDRLRHTVRRLTGSPLATFQWADEGSRFELRAPVPPPVGASGASSVASPAR